MIQIKWSQASLDKFKANLLAKGRNIETDAAPVLVEFAGQVMAESKAEIPIATGTAQSTAYIENPVVGPNEVSITMGYGGPNDKRNPDNNQMASEYLLYLHETKGTAKGEGYYHPYGKWKFLEDPLNRNKQIFIETLGKSIKTTLNKREI